MTPDEHNAEIAHAVFKLGIWMTLLGACVGAWVLAGIAIWEALT